MTRGAHISSCEPVPRQQVVRFVHDQQQQFGRSLKAIFDIMKRISLREGPFSSLLDWRAVTTFECPIELVNSVESPGLQLVDCILWLLQRVDEVTEHETLECRDLVALVADRIVVSEFSFSQLERDVVASHRAVMRLPVTAEQVANGQELLASMEARRKARMEEGED